VGHFLGSLDVENAQKSKYKNNKKYKNTKTEKESLKFQSIHPFIYLLNILKKI